MMTYERLSDIASVQSGLVLSRKEAPVNGVSVYEYRRVTLKALELGGAIDPNALELFRAKERLSGLIVTQENDIITRTFTPINPALITSEFSGLVVPSQLATIRVHNPVLILPEYVQYYLSQESLLSKLTTAEAWVAQRVIKITTIAGLEIPIPPVEDQRRIIDIFRLTKRKRELYEQLIKHEELLSKGLADRIIGG